MATSIIVLCLSCISTLTALRINNAPKVELSQSEKSNQAMQSANETQNVLRRACQDKKHCWVVFMGDSNMRNTYVWWTTQKLQLLSDSFVQSRQFGQEIWIDQDSVAEYKDGSKIRSSLRFLHGPIKEFQWKVQNFHKGSMHGNMDQAYKKFGTEDSMKDSDISFVNDPAESEEVGAIRPSKHAQEVTKFQKEIDWKTNSPALAAKLGEYEHTSPDVVILTEGWQGVPACKRFEETLDLMKKYPQTKFVWSPIYATNRMQTRADCFKPKMDNVAEHPKNVKFVDNSDFIKKYGASQQTVDAAGNVHVGHIGKGGAIMTEATERFKNAIDKFAA